MNKDQIIESIKTAFRDVKLGDGIGLWEAQAIDDYESEDVQRKKRETDEKDDWSSFTPDVLQRCHSSLSFFDADGMRFHLPAFIIGSMKDEVDDPVFHLSQLDDYARSKLTTLSDDQRMAVVKYLCWCLENEEFEHERPVIQRALDECWTPKI
jgi:uncharacterized protein DUF6714